MGVYILTKDEQKQVDGLVGSILPQSSTVGDLIAHRVVLVKGNYKFSRDGGAVGTITLKDELGNPIQIPSGLIVKDGLIIAKTAVTSGGSATLDLGVAGSAVFKSALAISGVAAPDAKALLIPVSATASTAVVLAAAGALTITIAVAALTAGELDVYLECYYRQP